MCIFYYMIKWWDFFLNWKAFSYVGICCLFVFSLSNNILLKVEYLFRMQLKSNSPVLGTMCGDTKINITESLSWSDSYPRENFTLYIFSDLKFLKMEITPSSGILILDGFKWARKEITITHLLIWPPVQES